MRIRKGDTVKVLVGKDAGRQGRVLKVVPGSSRVVVEGINIYKKHLKGDGQKKKSAIIDITKPLPISNVMLVCPSCGKPSRVGYQEKGGEKSRVCKKCGEVIDTVKEEKTEDKPADKKAPSKKKAGTKKKAKSQAKAGKSAKSAKTVKDTKKSDKKDQKKK
jgi:large subunit ribosomal protein L24